MIMTKPFKTRVIYLRKILKTKTSYMNRAYVQELKWKAKSWAEHNQVDAEKAEILFLDLDWKFTLSNLKKELSN